MKINFPKVCKGTSLLLVLLSMNSFSVLAEQKANILFIAVDDLKPLLGSYGNSQVISPNIDGLASQSTLFSKAYAQYPVCGPSRMSLMTGQHPETNGIMNLKDKIRDVNPDVLTLPQHFKNHGYQTAAVGKIFDPRNVESRESDDPQSWTIAYKKPVSNINEKDKRAVKSVDAEETLFVDGNINQRGKALLKQMAKDEKPFFLAVGYKKPHLPFVAPKKYFDLYDREKLSLASHQQAPTNSNIDYLFHKNNELRGYKPTPKAGGKIVPYPKGAISEQHQKELLHGYYASVSFIDSLVGDLLAELEATGQADNTIVVLWGDHGFHLGDHGLWGKHTTMEQANHVPLIIKLPGSNSRQFHQPVELLDIFPTLTEAAGLTMPKNLQGNSLVSIVKGAPDSNSRVAISQYKRKGAYGYSMRTDQYRYTEWLTANGKVVYRDLYDLDNDPLETKNIIEAKQHVELVKQLHSMLKINGEGLNRLK